MNLINDTFSQLVRRKLWPVALLLVVAAAAVPFLLRKTPVAPPAPAPVPVAAASDDAAVTKPVVALVDDSETPAKRHRVLGVRKDPFEPAPLPKVKHHKAAAKPKAVSAQATATPAATAAAPASSAAPSTPAAPVATATPAPVEHYPAHSVQVAFGKTGGALDKSSLTRLQTLPSSSPLLVFMGFHKGGRVAEFMLTGDVTAEGDGTCTPSVKSCETLLLHKGETEFLTFAGTAANGEYQLDVRDLHP